MLLRHTASALALAATLALNSAGAAPLAAATGAGPTPAATIETGGSKAGLTCLGCVATGVITLATGGWFGVVTTFLVGGTAAVAGGTAIITCTTACAAYLME